MIAFVSRLGLAALFADAALTARCLFPTLDDLTRADGSVTNDNWVLIAETFKAL